MTNEQKAKELCDCYSCKACSKFAEKGAAYALSSTCDRFDELMEAMQWKDKERKELWRITRNHYQEWAEEQERQLIDKLREVLSAHMHGGEIDEVLAELDEKIKGE
jgi:hypothetical protein